MKTYKRRILIIGLWTASMVGSFSAGVFLALEFYMTNDPVLEVTTQISGPPVDGPYYSVDDIVRANSEVKSFLSEQKKSPKYHHLHPRFVVVPELSGYTIYSSSGLWHTAFPKDLYESTWKVMEDSLGEINLNPTPPDTQ
jgi:hypothetical protein